MIPLVAALLKEGLGLLGGAVLAKGKDLVEEKLGVKLGEELTPEQIHELKKLEFQHEEWLIEAGLRKQQMALDETKVFIEDTQNARGMQTTALSQDDLFAKRFVYYFAIAIFLVSAVYIGAITFMNIPEDNRRFADTILGFLLGTLLATIINFFYGTSRASQNKDSTISDLVKGASK